MDIQTLNKELGNIDIYLLDQILKANVPKNAAILDAGCGEGRNLIYLLNNQYNVYGIDHNPKAIQLLHFILGSTYPSVSKDNFVVGELNKMPYDKHTFDYIICSAVLHFATSHEHFWEMIGALQSILCSGGILFIRMTSDIGLEGHYPVNDSGVFLLPDGSSRYLLTSANIEKLNSKFGFIEIEPVKTVNVANIRCMTTLVLRKK